MGKCPQHTTYFDTATAATQLQISERQIRRLAAQGKLEGALRQAGDWLIPRASIAAYETNRPTVGRPARVRQPAAKPEVTPELRLKIKTQVDALEAKHFDTGKLSIVYNLQRVRGKLDPTVEPKTLKSRRKVTMPATVAQALLDHQASQRQEKLRYRPLWHDSDLVFTTQIGTPLDPNDVSREFRSFLERNELPAVRFHDLRHAAGSIMLASGTPMYVVSRILGHSTIATTVNIYGHAEDEVLDEAAAAMGRALS